MEREQEPSPPGWVLARRYPDASSARRVWEAVRGLLLAEDLEASTFRFTLDGVDHVAVLGEAPLESDMHRTLQVLLDARGTHADVPDSALEQLRERRQRFRQTGFNYFEQRGGGPDRPAGGG